MIKLTAVEGLEFYVNIDYIQGVSKFDNVPDCSTVLIESEPCYVKGTPEEIVAMIHEAEEK